MTERKDKNCQTGLPNPEDLFLKNSRFSKNARGFTLLEIVVALAVLGILIAIAIPAYQNYTTRARVAEGFEFADAARIQVIEKAGSGQVPAGFSLLSKPVDYMTGLQWVPVPQASASTTPGAVVGYILPTMDLPGLGLRDAFALELLGDGSWRCITASGAVGRDAVSGQAALEPKYLPASCREGAALMAAHPDAPRGCPAGTQQTQVADANGTMQAVCQAVATQPAPVQPAPVPAPTPPPTQMSCAAIGQELVTIPAKLSPLGMPMDICMAPCPQGQFRDASDLQCKPKPATQPPASTPAPAPAQAANTPDPRFVCKTGSGSAFALCVDQKPSKNYDPCPGGVFSPEPGQDPNTFPMSGVCAPEAFPRDQTDPYAPVKCQVCAGPPELCDVVLEEKTCHWPNNVCINTLTNHADGSREIDRKCGTRLEGQCEYWREDATNVKCQFFDENYTYTSEFKCTYPCAKDSCNLFVNPRLPVPGSSGSTDDHTNAVFSPGGIPDAQGKAQNVYGGNYQNSEGALCSLRTNTGN